MYFSGPSKYLVWFQIRIFILESKFVIIFPVLQILIAIFPSFLRQIEFSLYSLQNCSSFNNDNLSYRYYTEFRNDVGNKVYISFISNNRKISTSMMMTVIACLECDSNMPDCKCQIIIFEIRVFKGDEIECLSNVEVRFFKKTDTGELITRFNK